MKGRRIAFLVLVFVLVISSTRLTFGESIDSVRQDYPKVLMFSAMDIAYLADSSRFWGGRVGINGFILSYLADWWTNKEKLFENVLIITELNKKGSPYGVDQNFIKVALGYGNLPNWLDDKEWAVIINNFKNIGELIKQSGTRGIAIDTEPYVIPLFDSTADRFKTNDKNILKSKVYQRGKQIMQVLAEVSPDIEVMILPEGAFLWFTESHYRTYELWIDFFNGMASVKNKNGIVVASERPYSVTTKDTINYIYNLNNKTMQEHVENRDFWQQKCSTALGMWPLGKTYSDKSARYSVGQFEEQYIQSTALSPKYVWIYDHGTAWFQMKKEEVDKYTSNQRIIWNKEDQVLPTDPAILDYYDVVKRKRSLKK